MGIQVINPLLDDRWMEPVNRHPASSAFHSRGWLEALSRTYNYEPIALTATPAGEPLRSAVVLCRVRSWMTGRRLVSLPFTDHCDLLLDQPDHIGLFVDWLRAECERHKYGYAELRPKVQHVRPDMQPSQSFWLHELDLSPPLPQLFASLHKDSIQRKIKRAEKENLRSDVGRSAEHLDAFYRLLLKTRRRHRLFPQPRSWFRNLLERLGHQIDIRLARQGDLAVAAMLVLRHKSTVIYKYGCSDERYHPLGGMPFLFWKLIEESKGGGVARIDFGRSDMDQESLIQFKDRFGTTRQPLHYYRNVQATRRSSQSPLSLSGFRRLIPALPDWALATGGNLLYRHMG